MKCVSVYAIVIFFKIITLASAGVTFTTNPIFRPFEGTCEFSAPLLVTASTKPVTLPKIGKLSIKDVKLPEGITLEAILSKIKSLSKNKNINKDEPRPSSPRVKDVAPIKATSLPAAPKLFDNAPEIIKQNYRSPDVRLLSDYVSPYNNLLSSRIECPVLTYAESNPFVSSPNLSSLPRISSSLKLTSGFYTPLSLGSEPNPVLSTSPSSYNSITSEFYSNSYPRAYTLPYPLYYKSTYLPKVRTPTYTHPYFCKPSNPTQEFKSKTIFTPAYSLSKYYNTAKTIEVPKLLSNIPLSTDSCTSTGLWPQSNPYFADFPFSGLFGKPINIPKLTCPSNSPNPPYLPHNAFNYGKLSFMPPTLPNVNLNHYTPELPPLGINDFPKYLDVENILIPDIFPIVDSYVETVNTGEIFKVQPFYNLDNVPLLQRINVAGASIIPTIPEPYAFNSPCFGAEPFSSITPSFILPTSTPCILEDSLPVYSPPNILQATPPSKVIPPSISEISSNIVSSVNNVLSDITQNIVSNCKSYLSSVTNIPKISPCLAKKYLPIQAQLPPVHIENPLPISYKYPAYMKSARSLSIESPASSVPPIVTILPPQTIPTYSVNPSFCPSYLPSPSLPSFTSVSSPFLMEPSRIKMMKTEDENQLLELLLIAEMLNEDANFDWDDLETLLALLYLT